MTVALNQRGKPLRQIHTAANLAVVERGRADLQVLDFGQEKSQGTGNSLTPRTGFWPKREA